MKEVAFLEEEISNFSKHSFLFLFESWLSIYSLYSSLQPQDHESHSNIFNVSIFQIWGCSWWSLLFLSSMFLVKFQVSFTLFHFWKSRGRWFLSTNLICMYSFYIKYILQGHLSSGIASLTLLFWYFLHSLSVKFWIFRANIMDYLWHETYSLTKKVTKAWCVAKATDYDIFAYTVLTSLFLGISSLDIQWLSMTALLWYIMSRSVSPKGHVC